MSTSHVYSANILSRPHPKIKIVPPLCLVLPGKEAYMPSPEGGAVEIDWQLLSPVTTSQHHRKNLEHLDNSVYCQNQSVIF